MKALLPLLLLLAGCASHRPVLIESDYQVAPLTTQDIPSVTPPNVPEDLWRGLTSEYELKLGEKNTGHGMAMFFRDANAWRPFSFYFGVEGYPPVTRTQALFAWFYFKRGWLLILGLLLIALVAVRS